MSDDQVRDVVLETSLEPSASIQLNSEWVAWLADAQVPASVEGVDPSIDYLSGNETGIA